MKQYVDLNIEIVVGVAIAILVRGSPNSAESTNWGSVVRRTLRIR